MTPPIPVLSGPRTAAWPASPDRMVEAALYLPIGEAMTRDFETDTHFQAISVPTVPHRLKKDALSKLPDGVPIVAMVFDVDAHELTGQELESWRGEQAFKVASLLKKHPGGFIYQTRGGYRVVYLLPKPAVIRTDEHGKRWRRFYQRCALYLARAFGIVADPGCADWTRLYRLPHATRTQGGEPENRQTLGDPNAIGVWEYRPEQESLSDDIRTAERLHAEFLASNLGATTSPYASIVRALSPRPESAMHKPSASFYGGESARARKALECECAELARLPKGARNPACNVAAVKLGHYVASGELTESTVVDALFDAMAANGSVKDYGESTVRGTIASGIAAGKKDLPSTPLHQREPRPNPEPDDGEPEPVSDDDIPPEAYEVLPCDDSEAEPPPMPGEDLVPGDDGLTAECTDLSNAERLVKEHGPDLLYCSTLGGWYVWDGARFARDTTGAATRRATHVVRKLLKEASKAVKDAAAALAKAKANGDEKAEKKAKEAQSRANKLYAGAAQSQSAYRLASMLTVAASARTIAVADDAFDRDAWALNVANGVLDLRTGKLSAHDRRHRNTKLAPVAFNPSAACPMWDWFLSEILPDPEVRAYVQRLAGYGMTGVIREHILPVFYGSGSNGKGTLTETIMGLLGDYARAIPSEMLMLRKGEAHPTERANLLGIRFAFASESEQDKTLAEQLIKQLTGGDRISARYMCKDFFEFSPTHKLALATNHRPRIRGTDHGIWRRVTLVPFTVTIPDDKQDTGLVEKLKTELPGILNWALAGCLDWQRNGLNPPETVKAATAEYRTSQDNLAEFLDARCVVEPGATVGATPLFRDYVDWCTEGNPKAGHASQRSFGEALFERGFSNKKDRKGLKVYLGLRLAMGDQMTDRRIDGPNFGSPPRSEKTGSYREGTPKGLQRSVTPSPDGWEYDA